MPVPKPVRDHLIEMYSSANSREAARNLDANRDCLVRMTTGKRQDQRAAGGGPRHSQSPSHSATTSCT